jgi:rhodanese-related sulfurtransferase/DNA-binding transcriptional ArsR family regulator
MKWPGSLPCSIDAFNRQGVVCFDMLCLRQQLFSWKAPLSPAPPPVRASKARRFHLAAVTRVLPGVMNAEQVAAPAKAIAGSAETGRSLVFLALHSLPFDCSMPWRLINSRSLLILEIQSNDYWIVRMKTKSLKSCLYEQVARISKALSSPKRLELLELLAQGEKSVETLCAQAGIDLRLTSAHLRALREAQLVKTRRDGKYVFYRLSATDVSQLWVKLRQVAEEHLVELRQALTQMASEPDSLCSESRESLLRKASQGEIFVIDVRPVGEYDAGHLPFARSMPLPELLQRLADLPADCAIVAYCRGPYCLMSDEAVKLLRARGYPATKISDGVSDWAASGLPVETGQRPLEPAR